MELKREHERLSAEHQKLQGIYNTKLIKIVDAPRTVQAQGENEGNLQAENERLRSQYHQELINAIGHHISSQNPPIPKDTDHELQEAKLKLSTLESRQNELIQTKVAQYQSVLDRRKYYISNFF